MVQSMRVARAKVWSSKKACNNGKRQVVSAGNMLLDGACQGSDMKIGGVTLRSLAVGIHRKDYRWIQT